MDDTTGNAYGDGSDIGSSFRKKKNTQAIYIGE
jgi:hypothetical protein